MKKFILVQNLDVYKLSRELSRLGWEIYQNLDWQKRKIIGDQFISALDSIGANIAEGYARYHYLEKVKFYYNARGSLSESCDHWLELLKERKVIEDEVFKKMKGLAQELSVKLNNFIASTYRQKKQ